MKNKTQTSGHPQSVTPEPEQKSAPAGENWVTRFFGALFSWVFSLLLSLSLTALVLLLFVHALNENVLLPGLGPVSGDWIAMFFDSWYCFALGGVLVLIPVLLLISLNAHRVRRIFLCLGCSGILTAIVCGAAVVFTAQLHALLPAPWQDAAVNATAVFRDFCLLCGGLLTALGAACVSVYSCITAIKGGSHEKDT